MPLLEIKDLKVEFKLRAGPLRAVDGVSLQLEEQETLGLVGESGCGKSVTALSIMGLLQPPAEVAGGQILFRGEDLLQKTQEEMNRIRGRKISMVFQEPMTSLNPSLTIGEQIAEVYKVHLGASKKEAREMTLAMLRQVKIPSAEAMLGKYPFEFSGGMRQRVMIAMALACRPDLLIADEPTTALDVTIQAQILHLLREMQQELKTALIFVSHNLGVIAQVCNRVAIMYAGSLVEVGEKRQIFSAPQHPYTQGLLASMPRKGYSLQPIPGQVCDLLRPPPGCKFAPRCHRAEKVCVTEQPVLRPVGEVQVACHFPGTEGKLPAVEELTSGGVTA